MRVGVESFNGNRLIQAREARGLTQTSLSLASGVAAPTISKWESGDQYPEYTSLEKVANVLGIPLNWFLRKMPNYGNDTYFFRSMSATTKYARNVAKTRLEWVYEITKSIEEWIEWPEVDIPDFVCAENFMKLTDAEIEEVAKQCRDHWKLGSRPITNVIEVMEQAGIIVVREEIGQVKMDGVSKWFEGTRPYVFLVADKASAVRSRFDAAHELGHIVLHKHVSSELYQKNTAQYKELEHQANVFASSFLLPAESVALELKHPTLDGLTILKGKWKTSIGAMIYRTKSLDLISEDYATRLWKNYSARGWRKAEPLDNKLTPEVPKLLSEAVSLLLREGGFSKEHLLTTLGLSSQDIISLCNLSDRFFDFEKATILQFKAG